jgi:hypothetical protein
MITVPSEEAFYHFNVREKECIALSVVFKRSHDF